MRHVDLLGAHLKCDFLCDLFETYEVPVTYDYDRTHEGEADAYRAEIAELGLRFVFDENQVLRTLFVQPVEISTFCPLAELSDSTPLFESVADAQRHAREVGATTVVGSAGSAGEAPHWIRFDHAGYSVHYEFRDARLGMITLQAART